MIFFTNTLAYFCEIIANISYAYTMATKEFAIIGPTASGKTDLALNFAKKHDSIILSLDSLSVYKEIDIASAKPTLEERGSIKHFGIDCIFVNDTFNVQIFINEYLKASNEAKRSGKSLIIVGGTSFYLKSLLNGLSDVPIYSDKTTEKVNELLENRADAHLFLNSIDKAHASKIPPADSFRMQKALQIYFETNLTPTQYFKENPPKPIIKNIEIFNITTERDELRKRIFRRTEKMIELGIIDETADLEKKFGRLPNPMHSIGIKEVLGFLDGRYNKEKMQELIATHTVQLAKRQNTFNNGQFPNATSGSLEYLSTKQFTI